MKVVILAGGYGTRISEESHLKPKPMIEIGEKPILWHIMKLYSHYGINDFIICCGYKQYVIKDYFVNYFNFSHVSGDFTPNELSLLFTIFVFMQFWNIFNAKAFMTGRSAFKGMFTKSIAKGFGLTLAMILAGQLLIVTFGGEMFEVVPLPLVDWLQIILGTSVILWIGELGRLKFRVKN